MPSGGHVQFVFGVPCAMVGASQNEEDTEDSEHEEGIEENEDSEQEIIEDNNVDTEYLSTGAAEEEAPLTTGRWLLRKTRDLKGDAKVTREVTWSGYLLGEVALLCVGD